KELMAKSLEKLTWMEDTVLCDKCYMDLVENPLRRGSKRAKGIDDQGEKA
ncbi:9019_t:CDS:1, partial [Dentiscutata heterogama]